MVIMNYLLLFIGDLFEALAFFAAIPSTIFSSVAQMFLVAGNINNENNDSEA